MDSSGTDNRFVSRFRPRLKKAALIILPLAALTLVVLYLMLPGWLEKTIRAEAAKIGIDDLRCRVLSVGPMRLELIGISLGDPGKSALRINRLSVGYSLSGLFKKRIKDVLISGLTLKAGIDNDGIHVPGIRLAASSSGKGLELPFDRLFLEQSRIILEWEKRHLEIPFFCRLQKLAGKPRFRLQAVLKPVDSPVQVEGDVLPDLLSGRLAISASGDIGNWLRKTGLLPEWQGEGALAARGKISFRESRLTEAAISLSSRGNLKLICGKQAEARLDSIALTFHLVPPAIPRDILLQVAGQSLRYETTAITAPFRVIVQGRNLEKLNVRLHLTRAPAPLPIGTMEMKGTISTPFSEPRLDGDFRLFSARRIALPGQPPLSLNEPLGIAGKFSLQRRSGAFSLTARLNARQWVAIHRESQTLSGHLQLAGELNGNAARLRGDISCRLAQAELKWPDTKARASQAGVHARFDLRSGSPMHTQGTLQIAGGALTGSSAGSPQFTGLELEFPWQWPASRSAAAGKFSAATLQAGENRLQNIRGIIVQNPSTIDFSGTARTGLAQVMLDFSGAVATPPKENDLRLTFNLQPVILKASTPLTPLHSMLQGISAGGAIQAGGTFFMRAANWDGSARLRLMGCELSDEASGVTVRGLETEVELPGLNDPRSAPDQRLRFAALEIGGIPLANGDFRFTLERGSVLSISSGRFNWSGGSVRVEPLRIAPGQEDVFLTLICDKINFAEMLNTLWGKKVADGDAELSGSIPMRIRRGTPYFLNGQLESQPGRGGRLVISQPQLISGGQLIVEEAIRDFRYESIRVKLNSPDERLDMVISMTGAPAQKLPLVYDAKLKDFVRTRRGQRHVELKGLSLDIRVLDVDLRELLKASEKMGSSTHKQE